MTPLPSTRTALTRVGRLLASLAALLAALPAHASFMQGETLAKAANVLAIVVIVVVPIVGIVVFWLVHVLPEKIAHKRHHPQTEAIQVLCLLSLVFGGLLWPLAWLWAYSKPVLYKMAYGTDKDEHHAAEQRGAEAAKPRSCARTWPARGRTWRGWPQGGALRGAAAIRDRSRHSSRGSRRQAEGGALMEILLLGIYSFFVWLIFIKFKWLPWNTTSQVTVAIIPIVAMTALILMLNVVAPSSADVRVFKYTIPIVSQVRGRVIEVPVEEGNRLVKKGDVLFRVDPTPYQLTVNSLMAQLVGAKGGNEQLKEQLRSAAGNSAAIRSRINLTQTRVQQNRELAATGAGNRFDLEQAETDLRDLEAQLSTADRQRGADPGPADRDRRR